MKFMSDTSLSELVTKIKNGFLPVKEISTDTGESSADLDTYQTTGIYIITGDGADDAPGNSRYGYLVVFKFSSSVLAQFWVERYVDSYYLDFPIFCRQYKLNQWSTWIQYPSVSDIASLQNGLTSIIQDNSTEVSSTWSSNKINSLLGDKLNTSNFTLSNITGTLPISKGGTGADNKFNAIANLAFNTVESNDSKNLNQYVAPCISCFSSTNPATGNLPSGSDGIGRLVVISPDNVDLSQIWVTMSSGKVELFSRTKVGGTWSNWEKIYTTNDDKDVVNPVVAGIATDVTNCSIYKKTGVYYMTGYIVGTPSSTTPSTVTLGYVPEGYRGSVITNIVVYNATENTHHTCTVYTNGSIRVSNVVMTSNSTQLFYLNTMWI